MQMQILGGSNTTFNDPVVCENNFDIILTSSSNVKNVIQVHVLRNVVSIRIRRNVTWPMESLRIAKIAMFYSWIGANILWLFYFLGLLKYLLFFFPQRFWNSKTAWRLLSKSILLAHSCLRFYYYFWFCTQKYAQKDQQWYLLNLLLTFYW